MDYEKAYKEALETARKINNGDGVAAPADWTVCETIFPVLREDYDDMIRGAIIDHLKDNNLTEWADWLEKQGEQKHTPKHKVGDTIYYNSFGEVKSMIVANVVTDSTDNPMYEDENGSAVFEEDLIEQNHADKVEPKFNFKVGQWIVSNHKKNALLIESESYGYFTFKDINGNIYTHCLPPTEDDYHLWTIQDAKDGDILSTEKGKPFIFRGLTDKDNPDSPVAYCGIDVLDFFCDSRELNNSAWTYDKVFPATKEQRDLLFQKIKEAGYEWDAEKKELKKIEDEEYNGEDYGIDSLYHVQRILEKTLGKVDGYQSDDGILEHKCAISAVKKLYEQKPNWSEEDKNRINRLIAYFEDKESFTAEDDVVYANWLKSLKDRVQPQTTWKPSDEQMENLSRAFNGGSYRTLLLMELYQDLKKLREE